MFAEKPTDTVNETGSGNNNRRGRNVRKCSHLSPDTRRVLFALAAIFILTALTITIARCVN